MEYQGQGNGPEETGSLNMRRPVQKKKTYTQRCGNCNSDDHHSNRCTEPTDKWGFIAVCPHTKCNTNAHIIDDCPHMKDKDRYMYQVVFRSNKAPLKSRLDFQNIAPPAGKQVDARSKPWTWQYAMAQARGGTLSSETPDPAYDSFAAIGPQVHPDFAAPGTYPGLPDPLPMSLTRDPHQVAGQRSNTRFRPPPNEYAIRAREAKHSQEHNPYSARGYAQAQRQTPYQAQHQAPYQPPYQQGSQWNLQPYMSHDTSPGNMHLVLSFPTSFTQATSAPQSGSFNTGPGRAYPSHMRSRTPPPPDEQWDGPRADMEDRASEFPNDEAYDTIMTENIKNNQYQESSFTGRSDQNTRTIAGARARARAEHRGRFASAYTTGIAGSEHNRSRSPRRRSRSPSTCGCGGGGGGGYGNNRGDSRTRGRGYNQS